MSNGEIRKTNKLLNAEPKIANFLPADMGLPLGVCGFIGLISFQCGLPAFWAVGLSLWAGSAYWLFVGSKPWMHLTKILKKCPSWGLGRGKYKLRHKGITVITEEQRNE